MEKSTLVLSTDCRIILPVSTIESQSGCPKVTSGEQCLSCSSSRVEQAKWKLLLPNAHMKKKVESLSVLVLRLCANSSVLHLPVVLCIIVLWASAQEMLCGFLLWAWITTGFTGLCHYFCFLIIPLCSSHHAVLV